MTQVNDNLILVCGKSASGKSKCLQFIPNPEGVLYLNCESGKKLPFKDKFKKAVITDPYQVYEMFTRAEAEPEIHTIIIDSGTFLMEMFESVHIVNAQDGRAAWGAYAQFWKNLMQQYVAKSTKNVIITAHVSDILNEKEGIVETLVKMKGSLMNNGIEAFFSNIITCKRVSLKEIQKSGSESDLLEITEDNEIDDFKYVFQTRLTRETRNERIRCQDGLWSRKETFIDNNMGYVLQRLHDYYAD